MPQYTYDPTQQKIVPLSEAQAITYISNDPEGIPFPDSASVSPYNVRSTAGDELLKKQGAVDASKTAAYIQPKINLDAAQKAYDAAVKNQESSTIINGLKVKLEEAKKAYSLSPTGIRGTLNALTPTPTPPPGGNVPPPGGKEVEPDKPVQPGKAWTWDGKTWVKPDKPGDGKSYTWDDNNGWTLSANGESDKELEGDFTTVNGILLNKGIPFSGEYQGKYYTDGKTVASKGAAWIWDGKAWVKPLMPTDGKTYTWNDAKGWIASTLNTGEITTEQTDSIAGIIALLGSYGIGDLGDAITKAIINGYSADTIKLIMQDPNSNDPLAVAFQKRFPANKILAAQGKPVLSPGEYLAAEKRYTEIMQSYGVAGLATRSTLSDFIGNNISATEVSDRVGLAVDRVQNADANTKKMLATYYPMLNTNDIVTAMLNPKEGLPALQRKVQIAEIGGAALTQGLNTSLNAMSMKSDLYSNVTTGALGAQQLAEQGITKEQARLKYEQVAEVLPRGEFLSAVSGGEDYTRLQAEQEAFLGLASAKRARENLVKQEQARFAGSSGTSKASLTSPTKGMLY